MPSNPKNHSSESRSAKRKVIPALRLPQQGQRESTMAPSTAGRAKACTSCRQVKLRCDSADTFPAACTRCSTRGYECRMNANFKRVATRFKLKEVTSELSNLKEVIKSQSAQQNIQRGNSMGASASASLSADNSSTPSFTRRDSSYAALSSNIDFYGIEDAVTAAYEVDEQCLGDLHLDGVTVVQLFEHFYQHYYSSSITLDVSLQLSMLAKESPLLFWSIIIQASKFHPQHSYLFSPMLAPYQQLLASHLIRPIHKLPIIHAILILCFWPLPVNKQPDDPTWNYCGLITNAAINIGLHRPGREREYGFPRSTERDIELRSRTWLQIFQLNTLISTRVGVPHPLADEPSLRNITQITMDTAIDKGVRDEIEIAKKLAKWTQHLQLDTKGSMCNSLIQMGCNELEAVQASTRGKWQPEITLQYLGSKLFLYSWCFHDKHQETDALNLAPRSPASEPESVRRLLLYEAMETATRYIHTFGELETTRNESQPPLSQNDQSSLVYLSKHYNYTLYHAALTLYHFLSTVPSALVSDQELARNHIGLAHTILTRSGVSEHAHEWNRLAHNIELVGEFHKEGRRLPPEARIESRLGASLFYDAMLKISVMKAEHGVRSAAVDLTQSVNDPLPDSKMVSGVAQARGAQFVDLGAVAGCHQQMLDMHRGDAQQTEWESGLWGWDIAMLDAVDLNFDWNSLGDWQL